MGEIVPSQKDFQIERIKEFIAGKRKKLTVSDQEYFDKISFADVNLRSHRKLTTVKDMIVNRFNVHPATAQRYMNEAMSIFGSLVVLDPSWLDNQLYDLTMDALTRARAKNDVKTEAILLKTLSDIRRNMKKAVEQELNDYNFTQTNIQIVADPSKIKGLQVLKDSEVESLIKRITTENKPIIDVDAEEI